MIVMDADTARAAFAEELRYIAHVKSGRVIEAFGAVRREAFWGQNPGRSRICRVAIGTRRRMIRVLPIIMCCSPSMPKGTSTTDIRSSGQRLLDRLNVKAGEKLYHVGAGTGYYTAIMAELVGRTGSVIAVEIDPDLSQRATLNLASYTNVEVVEGDGTVFDPGPVDVVIVNAGATLPMPISLSSLLPGGRLLEPLTADSGRGSVLRVERLASSNGFSAKFVLAVSIFPCAGARTPKAERALARALADGGQRFVQALRCDDHQREATCWLHGEGYCLSIHPVER